MLSHSTLPLLPGCAILIIHDISNTLTATSSTDRSTTMALTQRQRNKPIARPYFRSSLSLRIAAQEAPVKVRVQRSSLNRKSPIRSNATYEIGTNSDSIHHTRQVTLSQRSSLRRALRESLKLIDKSIHSTTEPESIDSSTAATLPQRPQRSSLRRAIRDSLAAAIDTCGGGGGSRVSRANDVRSKPAQSLLPGLIAAKKLDFETPHQTITDRHGGTTYTRHSFTPKARATSHAISQRSSLRRAIHESRNATVQSIEPIDTTSHETSPSQTPTNTIHDPSDDNNGNVISPLGSSPTIISNTSKPLPEEGISKAASQFNRTSSVIPCTTYQTPVTAMAYRPLAASPPQQGLMPELSSLAEPPAYQPLLPKSRSFSNHFLTPKVDDESSWLKSTWHQNLHLTSSDRGIRDNQKYLDNSSDSQSMPNQKGWHYVREIISEAPGGLFLVEWEERDARTGSKWPASWVKAKDVSMCAIQDWENKK
ncbi:hypothetical protein FHL15_010958 [Xylaria flabelliformis]|uniref:Chromo domain-containing protein n=1 Tax=Xylaria flabelliformis TaxID=2512241 RepID=A0A553HJM8_9PEZI|nr:hypothetical protein FHL15_010958 [Xylaria flabelliformis]